MATKTRTTDVPTAVGKLGMQVLLQAIAAEFAAVGTRSVLPALVLDSCVRDALNNGTEANFAFLHAETELAPAADGRSICWFVAACPNTLMAPLA